MVLSAPFATSLPERPAALVRFPVNGTGRDFAVGDIHGAFSALQRGLDHVGFDPTVDRLFAVGDLVDRGPESHAVLDWLDRPWFHALCGNHDYMTWRSALGVPFRDVEHEAHGGVWLRRVSPAERQRIGERLAALPMAFEVETDGGTVGMVHADFPSDDWRDLATIDWQSVHRIGSPAGQCLWSIDRHRQQYDAPVRHVRAVVHGHMTIPAAQVLGNVHYLDTGGWRRGGHFSFLELHALRVFRGPTEAGD